jgi:hypothetical protein
MIQIPQSDPRAQRQVRLWVRAFAWFFFISAFYVVGWCLYIWFIRHTWLGLMMALGFLSTIWLTPMFAYVALKGRTPEHYPGIRRYLSR